MVQLGEVGYAHSAAAGAAITAFVLGLNLVSLFFAAVFTANEADHDNRGSVRITGLMLLSALPCAYVALGIMSDNPDISAILVSFGAVFFAFNIIGSVSSIKRFKESSRKYGTWRHWLDGNTAIKYHIVVRVAHQYNNFRPVIFLSGAIVFSLFQAKANQDPLPVGSATERVTGFIVEYLVSLFVLGIAEPVFRWFYPGDALIGECFRLRLLGAPFSAEADSTKVGRWRSQRHRSNFKISRSIEVCVRATKKRVGEKDFKQLAQAYSGVALKLQQHSLREQNDHPIDEVLKWACVSLVVNDNPVRSAKRIDKILCADDDVIPAYLDSKYNRFLNTVNTTIESHRLIITTIAPLAVIGYYLTSGEIGPLIKFLKSIMGGA